MTIRQENRVCEYYQVASFTSERFQGNPAGVILTSAPLSRETMQRIAGEVQLESVFAVPVMGEEYEYDVAYYTGVQRIPLCGHDTIALGTVLAYRGEFAIGAVLRIRTDIGILKLQHFEDGWIRMSQAAPQFGEIVEPSALAKALGVGSSALGGASIQVASTGTPFLIAPVRDQGVLDSLNKGTEQLAQFLATLPENPVGLYCWALSDLVSGADVIRARCFCPGAGLPEDPATGSASGAFRAYLIAHGLTNSGTMLFWQGDRKVRMGYVRAECEGKCVHVSGQGTIFARGELWV